MRQLLFLFLILSFALNAQIPTGYYNTAQGLTGTPLRLALHNIIDNHNSVSYNSLWTHFQNTDKKSNGKVWDMYSDIPSGTPPYQFTFNTDQCGSYSVEGDCYNREHVWPQSFFNSSSPMVSDLFHIYPTDGKVNGFRSNYAFGPSATTVYTVTLNGSKLALCDSCGTFSGVIFEPIDDYKGDIARSIFYMSTRYYTEDASWITGSFADKAELYQWAIDILINWHHLDPVSTKETNRNNVVYGIQSNRNPYIDHPEWADSVYRISPVGLRDLENAPVLFSVFPNPNNGVFSITTNTGGKEFKLLIYNCLGQLMHSEKYAVPEINLNLDLPPGMYSAFLQTGDGRNSMVKFITKD
ncbi:MAG: endonuclease [Bacteroidota bacterium]|nr:endonuclease [Bacteroidota bacterium]